MIDASIEDQGEFYDNEKEGGDIRNEQSFKRSGSETEIGDVEIAKKPKIEVYLSFLYHLVLYFLFSELTQNYCHRSRRVSTVVYCLF